MISRSGIGEIQPANCQMTAADVAAIAMIRNNAVWIHGLRKYYLRSWTDKFGHFYACVREMTGQGPPAPRKHVNNFRCDLLRDAGKTTRSGAMNTKRITIPRPKLRKYCHGQVSRMFIHGFSSTTRKPRRSWIHGVKFSKWRTLGTMRTLARFTNPNLNLSKSEP